MKHEISLETLVMAKRALEDMTQAHLEYVVKDFKEFDRTADMRKRAYKAASLLDIATFILLKQTNLEVTDGTTE
jgi:hypothetical protein